MLALMSLNTRFQFSFIVTQLYILDGKGQIAFGGIKLAQLVLVILQSCSLK